MMIDDGVLNIKKEAGWTSHDVVARLRRTLRGVKVGHAGTLDPQATGVLPMLIGRGTRLAEYLLDWDKEYRAVLRLGETTDTLDATGHVLERRSTAGLADETILKAISFFKGHIQQIPPMYSAVKIRGVPLYRAAREGRIVDRAARMVMISRIEVDRIDGADVFIRVVCSKGTYIRTLCADIGQALGVGGHLLTLERTRVGPLQVNLAATIDTFEASLSIGQWSACFLSLDAALQSLPACIVDDETAYRVLHGAAVPWTSILVWESGPEEVDAPGRRGIRIRDQGGRLLAIGRWPGDQVTTTGGIGSRPPIAVEKVLMNEETVKCG
jgi:tRNA pseudouridine55 synthase